MIAAALRAEADDGDPADTLDFDLDQVARGQPERGLAGEADPPGVPVAITSPSRSVVKVERNSIVRGTSKIIWPVLADCMTSPFSVVVSRRSDTSISSAVMTSGPIGMVPSKFLPGVHWVAARCHSRAVPSITTT